MASSVTNPYSWSSRMVNIWLLATFYHDISMCPKCCWDLGSCINPPKSRWERPIFWKYKYKFTVFDWSLLTDTGKALVWEHGMITMHRWSMKKLSSSTSSPQRPHWNFLTYFHTSHPLILVQIYIQLHPSLARPSLFVWKPSPIQRLFFWWLQMSIASKCCAPCNGTLISNEPTDQHKTQTRKELTYEQYCNLLLSAASADDAMFAAKETLSLHPKGCAIYLHDKVELEF